MAKRKRARARKADGSAPVMEILNSEGTDERFVDITRDWILGILDRQEEQKARRAEEPTSD